MEILNYSAISKHLFSNSSPMLDYQNADLLKCGSCCTEFLLSDICMFIQHKNKQCCIEFNDQHYQQPPAPATNSLRCSSCSETFKSAYSLLEHAQYFHRINLFTNNNHNNKKHQAPDKSETDDQMVTPKKEIFVDVTPPTEHTEKTPEHEKARSTSLSLSSTSPTVSTTSSISSNYLSQGSFKEPSDNTSQSQPKQRCNSISFDFRDSTAKPQANNSNFRRGSQTILLDQNDNTCSSMESSSMNNSSFYMMQNSLSPKNLGDASFEEKTNKRLSISCGDEKKKKSKQQASFYCDVCHAAFNQKIHLTKHSAKHTGIKPFKCTECNYSTVERSHLKVHVRVHTGEKPFKCSFCDYATAQSSTLKIHKKRHHDKQIEPILENKFRDSNQQADDSQTQPGFEIDTDSIKCERVDNKDLSTKTGYEQFTNFYSQQSFNPTGYNMEKRAFSMKRTKTFLGDRSKRVPTSANYYDVTQRLVNKNPLGTIFNLERPEENSNFGHNVNGIRVKSKQTFGVNGQLTEAENKLLGLANIALEREIN